MSLDIHIIDMRHVQDNYNFVLHNTESGLKAVVDPSNHRDIIDWLEEQGWEIDYILNTHHHWDHTNGNKGLKRRYACKVVGFAEDAHRIPEIDICLQENEPFIFGSFTAETFRIDGHTIGHIAYYFPQAKAVFCGDTLFAMGCGRMFEGTPELYVQSLNKLANLPDDTRVYCAHEYTIANGRFARSVEPDNEAISAHIEQAKQKRRNDKPTIPSTIAIEKQTNPFLRLHSPKIREKLGLSQATDTQVFARLRAQKDQF